MLLHNLRKQSYSKKWSFNMFIKIKIKIKIKIPLLVPQWGNLQCYSSKRGHQ